ncbi:porin [Sansalvadorimonas sp. 2012CJ34-2]|uniref:Porin n=1 Tax=Parendozoicomonas callyspongiae TaxID=2942213 RepID=A0ABT0PDK3_9GAMM|nr:porin [Sansalvadorimonas sp. 2012CJ34-2]MCL6269462.1 porin [Sansalvadorimonas sp. 2012CJ34-2]
MKKLVLAAAIAAVAGNAMAFEAYNADGTTVSISGEVRTLISNTENDNKGAKFDMGGSKLAVSISHKLSDDLTAEGFMRFAADLNDGSAKLGVDKGYLALGSAQYGKVSIGVVGTAYDDLMGGYDASVNFGGAAKLGADTNGAGGLQNGINYTWSNDSMTVVADYGLEDKETTTTIDSFTGKLDKTYGLGASWTSDFGLTLTGAYGAAKLDNETTEATAKAYGFEADYSFGAFSVGAIINKSEEKAGDTKIEKRGFGTGAAYSFLDNGTAYAGYNVVKTKGADDKTKTYNAGVQYMVHPQVKVFADIAQTKAAEKTNEYALGARVYF